MKFFTRAVDRFCAKHPRFGVRNLMLCIVIVDAAMFLFTMMDASQQLLNYLVFVPSLILKGQVWRLVTFIFIPESSNLILLALFLYFYYFIGSNLENTWGTAKFTVYYLTGILINVIFGFVIWFITGSDLFASTITANYLNLSMFLAFASIYPDTQVMFFFIIPVKVKWLALLDALYFVYVFITYPFPLNFMPFIAVLNFILFCWDDLISALQPLRYRLSSRRNVRPPSHKPGRGSSKLPYSHKCSVCGRTDTDFPNLEFRYCSRCVGYHCFCEDHINNHVHFRE